MAKTDFAMTQKGIRLLLVGLVVIVAGFILLAGGGVKDPQVFNYEMFNFQRLVAAPIVMVCGVVIIIAAIMKKPKEE